MLPVFVFPVNKAYQNVLCCSVVLQRNDEISRSLVVCTSSPIQEIETQLITFVVNLSSNSTELRYNAGMTLLASPVNTITQPWRLHVRQVTSNIQHLTFDITKTNPRNVQIKWKNYWIAAINLQGVAIVRSISDAIFLLSSPNVRSLSQWRILLFVRTTSSVILTISLQKH